jgi:hypothetical protein
VNKVLLVVIKFLICATLFLTVLELTSPPVEYPYLFLENIKKNDNKYVSSLQ